METSKAKEKDKNEKNEKFVPVLPIRNAVIFPGTVLPLRVGRTKSVAAVKYAEKHGLPILAVTLKKDDDKEPTADNMYRYGTLCKIEKIRGNKESGFTVLVRGEHRFHVDNYEDESEGFIGAIGSVSKDASVGESKIEEALLTSLKSMAKEILELLPTDTTQLLELVEGIEDLSYLSYLCAANLELGLPRKQALLESDSLKERVLTLLGEMQSQKDSLKVQSEIRDKLGQKMGKMQRESILRQQLNAIREELGENGESSSTDQYRKKIDEGDMPEEVKKVANEELKRLDTIGNSSPESHVIRSYLDLLTVMPWKKSASEEINIEAAKQILDADHYGLQKIKKRILQHLAVMKLKKGGRGTILILVGPPGVGKTSLGQSIAKALGRKFVRGSLGGVRDDAEIRGHRRTYIGAMPGRVIQGIKRSGENNPVFMLDEIDKMARGFQGDPASALLEVLDPEQNATFLDHYLDVPFDLSKVVFIATANTLESIPAPLLDRMEVIELTGYTTAEKLHIAKNHLIPKQLEEHGLLPEQISLADEALMRIITHYTREAGVRDLQRHIAAVCRWASEKIVSQTETLKLRIELGDLDEIFGPERHVHEVANHIAPPGVVTGLAWTPQGGEILFIEASLMPGTGKLILTGQLGEVMKESAQIALSLVRSRLPSIVPGFEYDKKDLHIHVPAGAIPKDGPSAGIAMLTTIASLFSGRTVNPKFAMTGEVTLRGAVMPVGGIKEKVIAAHRAGIEKIILSKRNQKDLREVPEEVKTQMKFEFVDTIAEVFKAVLDLDLTDENKLNVLGPPPSISPPPAA
jgi:ATP-dependent Lon protease